MALESTFVGYKGRVAPSILAKPNHLFFERQQVPDAHASVGLGVDAISVLALGFSIFAGWRAGARSKRVRRSASLARQAARVFIDGEAGTTGLQVRERLARHPNIEIVSLDRELRKDEFARQEALCSCDAAVLCLPDAASIEATALLDTVGADTVLVDASTAHRVADGWVYGFPELTSGQADKIAASKRIANPGCYATGFIALIRPLVERGVLSSSEALSVHAVSGYSGGGKDLISLYDGGPHEPWGAYGFGLEHKHLPEMARWTGLVHEPVFCPSVADFLQGMVVTVPLRISQLEPGMSAIDVHAALTEHYAGQRFVSVAGLDPFEKLERGTFLRPDAVNNTNSLELFCFHNPSKDTLLLLARLDNLGKGASGACVQNLNLALGFDEGLGLDN